MPQWWQKPVEGGAPLKQLAPLQRAIEYIEAHLDEDIGLSDVSRETGYSYHYMTRLFSTVLGESVGRYINRRRLYKASKKLIHTQERVLDIALASGFGSSEAFSRAFKTAFGSSPVAYRQKGLDLVVNAKRELAPEDVVHVANNISHAPALLWLEAIPLAGIRGTTALSNNRIPGLWERFLRQYKEFFATTGAGFSVCETQPTRYTEDGDVAFTVMVGSPIKDPKNVPEALDQKTLPAGRYAVFTHRGTFANLFKTYQYIFGTWLPAAEEELDDREDFEFYAHEVRSFDDPENLVKIFIPIK